MNAGSRASLLLVSAATAAAVLLTARVHVPPLAAAWGRGLATAAGLLCAGWAGVDVLCFLSLVLFPLSNH